MQDHGNIGVIISNSWLSSDWGIKFRVVLQKHFHIKAIATSGRGRWFDATDVVANIVVLSKKHPSEDDKTLFFYTKKDIGQWDSDYINNVCAEALLAKRSEENRSCKLLPVHEKGFGNNGQILCWMVSVFSPISGGSMI